MSWMLCDKLLASRKQFTTKKSRKAILELSRLHRRVTRRSWSAYVRQLKAQPLYCVQFCPNQTRWIRWEEVLL
jgi:hypothetical protein